MAAPPAGALVGTPAAPPTPLTHQAGAIPPDLDDRVFDWLIDLPPGLPDAPRELETRWLAELDQLILADKGRGELLPRAAGLIPQLLNALRDEDRSTRDLADHITRDANLVAELIRLANSPAFRRQDPVTDLADAVRRVGTSGVRQAITKIVLKPMFDVQDGGWPSRAAPKLWHLSQAQADLSRAMAVTRGMDPFEAYLGGLLGHIGWTAGLRAMQRVLDEHPAPSGTGFSENFRRMFRSRRDRLFVQLVTSWRLNPALHQAARAVQQADSFERASDPLAQVLIAAERLAAWHTLARDEAEALLEHWPEHVADTFRALPPPR